MQAPRIRRRKTSATSVSLFVRWYNPSGKTKVSHLALKPIETVDALQVTFSHSFIHSFMRLSFIHSLNACLCLGSLAYNPLYLPV